MPTIKTPAATGCITTTTGTGTYALGTALTLDGETLKTFSEAQGLSWIADADQVYYTCKNASGAWEFGIGTYAHVAQTLARTTILKSTNGNGAVSWGAGNKSLYCSYPPEQLLLAANNLSEVSSAATARTNLGATATGGSLFTAASAAAARSTLGSTTVGDALFIAASAAAGRTALGLGTSSTLDVDSIFPSNKKIPFFEATAPSGWVKDTTHNDKALRAVSGTGGGSGGSRVLSATVVGETTLTIAQIPSHNHNLNVGLLATAGATVNIPANGGGALNRTDDILPAGGGTGHDHALALAYIDVIICHRS